MGDYKRNHATDVAHYEQRMPLNSIHNGRGFFSDYWLGSVLSAKKTKIPKLSTAQAKKLLWWLSKLHDRVDTVEPPALTDFRERFARPLLQDVFGYQLLEDGNEPRLRLLARADDVADKKRLACVLLAPEAEDADTRQMRDKIGRALLDYDLNYGFVLTPHALRLVRKPGLGNRGAYFEFAIAEAVESEDLDSLDVAVRILRADNFVAADGEPPVIESLEHDSQVHSARVSEDLKQAVFSSAEMLIRGLLEDVQHRPEIAFVVRHVSAVPAGGTETKTPLTWLTTNERQRTLTDLRDDALLTLYRLLFILYAESRDERLQTHALYWKNYSLDSLVESLLRMPEDAIAGNRFGYWAQLQALLRIYDQGLPPVPGLQNIPPRGGRLFSAKTPSGEFLTKVQLPDRLVARLILTLATTRPRRGVGRERVSYREMQIEQLGSVYEGLLEYEPRIATGTMIEVKVAGRQFVLPPAELVRLCEMKELALAGLAEIVAGTEAARLHPELFVVRHVSAAGDEQREANGTTTALTCLTTNEDDDEDDEENENEAETEDKGVKKGAPAKLIRRLENGEFYFVPGSARKSSGSFYTIEEIVQYLVVKALGHLVEGRTAAQILLLRIIDIACGSGHFLVGAARYLGHTLFEAYQREARSGLSEPPPEFSPDLSAKERHARWETEGEAWCKRCIVEKCLFGVDLNPTAVQLAQVALWIESLAGDRPLSFFEHHIRCGNSLLGSWLDTLHIPPHPDLEPTLDRNQLGLFEHSLKNVIREALQERQLIDAGLPAEIRKDSPQEYEYKADRLQRAETLLLQAKLLFDLRNAAAFIPAIWGDWRNLLGEGDPAAFGMKRPWWNELEQVRQRERFFHWELEFPEVFFAANPGFDGLLGNPPWDKVLPDRQEFYGRTDVLIRAYTGGDLDVRIQELHAANAALKAEFNAYTERVRTTAQILRKGPDYKYCDWIINGEPTGGHPDLFKFFVERAVRVLREGGRLGYLVPSAIYSNEGCTGVRHLILDETKVIAFFGFENWKKIFDIHSSYKFVCLVLEKGKPTGPAEFLATFARHDVDELVQGAPKEAQVFIGRTELEKLSPGTLAFLEYHSERERQIILKMYGALPGMQPRPLLGVQGVGVWNAKFYTEFNLTNDRDLWTKPNGQLWSPESILGNVPGEFQELRVRMAEKGFWPLYQDAHIQQYVLEYKPLMRWVSLEAHERKYGKTPNAHRKLVIRDPARNTDERTCIAALLPENSCFGHTLNGVHVVEDLLRPLLVLINSIVFDYQTRKRVGGQHVSPYLMNRSAAVSPDSLSLHNIAVPEIHANQVKTWVWDDPGNHASLWKLERQVAIAYGLTAEDFAYILTTFPGFTRKRPAFYAFLQQRVAEWRAE